MIPSVSECFLLMDKYEMLENIKEHSVMVARVAGFIVKEMHEAGKDISMDLTLAAALMHDIAKTSSLNSNEDHAQKGRELCLSHEFYEIADIVGEHVVLANGVPKSCCREKEIVYYADKRVLHDKVVSLDDRLEYILERYGNNDTHLHHLIKKNFTNCRLVEEKIFNILERQPDDVSDLVNGHLLILGNFQL